MYFFLHCLSIENPRRTPIRSIDTSGACFYRSVFVRSVYCCNGVLGKRVTKAAFTTVDIERAPT